MWSTFQVCQGVSSWAVLLLHLPASLLAVSAVVWRRGRDLRSWDLLFDATKHVSGALVGQAALLFGAPLLAWATGWSTPCWWYFAACTLDGTLGFGLQIWVVTEHLVKFGRKYPEYATGLYWNPWTAQISPRRFGLQLALWVAVTFVLRTGALLGTLVLATPVALAAGACRWAAALSTPVKLIVLGLFGPLASRAAQFMLMDPLIEGTTDTVEFQQPFMENEDRRFYERAPV